VKLLLAAALLLLAGCGGESQIGAEPDLSEPAAMMLRLSDLPAGFRYGDDGGCGDHATTDGHHPKLDEFLFDARPRWCVGDFTREWGGPPRNVSTAVFLFDSDSEAGRAWEFRRPLFDRLARIRLTNERARGETVAFDSEGLQQLGAGEAWHDGRRVVAVYEEGLAGEAGRRFAHTLAVKQRARIESPSSPQEEHDRELALEDPALGIPVYWLGRRFAPPGLPVLTLERAEYVRDAPGREVEIDYAGEGSRVALHLWRAEEWRASRRPTGLTAVPFDEVVVTVEADGPYDSPAGKKALVRGLRRR
jgi:hypothetical protein